MNLDKAKEIVDLNIREAGKTMPSDTLEALKLASEALKVLQHGRTIGAHHDPFLLPGETEE